jgi:hypothetical protein
MKDIIIIFLILFQGISFGQEKPCVNNVNTNPNDDPTPNHINALPLNINAEPDLKYLNGWQWWYDYDPNSINSIELNNMGLNPGEWYGDWMEHFNGDASQGFYYYLSKDYQEVMLPQNGWELLANSRGWYPDNETDVPMNHLDQEWLASPSLRSLPYMLFYNKYTGMARVFVRYGQNTHPDGAINGVKISIRHPNKNEMSGMLRLADGYDRTLDQESIIQKVTTVVQAPSSAQEWYSADFQLAFDPCVCYYESNFELVFRFLSKAEINLRGAAITAPVNLVQDNNIIEQDFLGSFDQSNGSNVEGGYMIYKHLKHLVDDYYEKLEVYKNELYLVINYNAEVERQLALLGIGKVILTAGVTAVTGMPAFTALLGKTKVLKQIADSDVFGKNTQKAFWKELDKVLSLGFKLLTKESLEKKDKPEEPTMPTASATEMRFSGSIINFSQEKQSSVINTPGSLNANSNGINNNQPQRYPIYNEAVGIFALLEKPKLEISRTISQVSCDYLAIPDGIGEDRFINTSYNSIFQFELDEPLKYTFNNALSIVDYSIDAAIVINGILDYDYPYTNSLGSQHGPYVFNDPSLNVNIESMSFNPKMEDTLLKFLHPSIDTLGHVLDSINIQSIFTPIDAFNNLKASFGSLHESRESITDESLFNPEFCDITTDYLTEHENRLQIKKASLKLLINVTYEGLKSDGSPNDYTYMFTYSIDPINDIIYDDINPLYSNLIAGGVDDISQYPEELLLDGENFDGSAIDGCQFNGSTYLCKAFKNVNLTGEFTVANGYNVIVEAGNEVIVTPGAITPPEMIWQIVPVWDYSNPLPPVDETYVSNFCNDETKYKANSSKMAFFNNDSTIVYEKDVRDIFAFNIFPNPTSGSSTVSITLNESAKGDLFITDMNGRTLGTAFRGQTLRGGKTEHQLPTASLARGIYLVHLFVDGERHVKRLVKQ